MGHINIKISNQKKRIYTKWSYLKIENTSLKRDNKRVNKKSLKTRRIKKGKLVDLN